MAVSADRTGSRAVFEGKLSGRLRRRKCRDEKETAGEHPEPSKRAMRPAVPTRKIRSGQIWGPKRVALFSGPVLRKNGVLRGKKSGVLYDIGASRRMARSGHRRMLGPMLGSKKLVRPLRKREKKTTLRLGCALRRASVRTRLSRNSKCERSLEKRSNDAL